VIRAVVDTIVLVSALIVPTGNEALILLAIRQGLIKPSFSEEILEEYAEVLARRKFGFPRTEINYWSLCYEVKARRSRDPSRSLSVCQTQGTTSSWHALKPGGSILL